MITLPANYTVSICLVNYVMMPLNHYVQLSEIMFFYFLL